MPLGRPLLVSCQIAIGVTEKHTEREAETYRETTI